MSRHLHKYIVRRPEYKDGNYEQAIIKGFLECDEAMKTDESLKDEMSGSTAITMLYRYEIINMYFDSLRQKFFFSQFQDHCIFYHLSIYFIYYYYSKTGITDYMLEMLAIAELLRVLTVLLNLSVQTTNRKI